MAQTTMELRHLLSLKNFDLFDFEYKFDDHNFKKELEQSIIDYYFFYEIGQETPDRFKHVFQTRFLSMIGYYNKLYNTTLLTYNPLTNYSVEEALQQLSETNNQRTSSSNTTLSGSTNTETTTTREQTENVGSNTKNSDYPQQPISSSDYLAGETQTNENRSTDVSDNSDSTVTTQDMSETDDQINDSGTTNTNYTKTIEGLTGTTYQELIRKERENLIRIKSMVIEELKPCFMLTY